MEIIKTYDEFINESVWSDIRDRANGEAKKKEDEFIYYQPIEYIDDGTNMRYGDIPRDLPSSSCVFETEEEAKDWLENNGYNPDEFIIMKYEGDDIEDPIFINADGEGIEN